MPKEYLKIREAIREQCLKGDHPGKKEDEDCLTYAKRLASAIYTKRYGKTPQEAESAALAVELLDELVRRKNESSNT